MYDIDNGFSLAKTISIPTGGNPRGAVASAATGMLYVSYGPDSSSGGGSMFKYNLVNDTIVWNKTYPFGIDSMSISPDGSTIYMPTGEVSSGGIWEIIDAAAGNVTGSIDSGAPSRTTRFSMHPARTSTWARAVPIIWWKPIPVLISFFVISALSLPRRAQSAFVRLR